MVGIPLGIPLGPENSMTRYPKQGKGARWTELALKAIPPEWRGDTIADGDGLNGEVRVGQDGSVTVAFKYGFKWQQKGAKFYCGTWPMVGLADIRRARDEARDLLRSGVNPNAHRQVTRIEEQAKIEEAIAEAERARLEAERRLTLRGLFDHWKRVALTPQTRADGSRTGRKDGGQYVEQAFARRIFPRLGHLAAVDVRRADLLAILDETKAEGHARVANQLLTDLSQMFRFAVQRELVPKNPLDGIRRADVGGRETERERVLNPDEIRALRDALPAARMAPRSALAIWLILATGCRIGEAMGAVWADGERSADQEKLLRRVADKDGAKFGVIDLEARTWHIPDTKNGRSHTIHLSDFAMGKLRALAELREVDEHGESVPWVFPARDLKRPVCIKSFGKQLGDRQREPERRMSGRSKNTQSLSLAGGRWTAHDLRRTAGTLMASLEISGDVIDECLNHKIESRVRRTYIRDRREAAQARAFDALGRYLSTLLDGAQAGQVIELRAA